MTHAVTLIAAPGAQSQLAALSNELREMLEGSQLVVWLSERACDVRFRPQGEAGLALAHDVVNALRSRADRVDAVIQRTDGRRKSLLMADMDSTIIQQECLDEIAFEAGIGPKIAAITERAMRGELDFESALRERVGLLKGFPEARLQHVLDARIQMTAGATVLTATMRAHGGRAVLVSGGFTFFTSAVAAMAGFDANYGNSFIMENGAIVGVADPILGQDAKLTTTQREAAAMGIPMSDVMAIGDGANDLAMLGASGLGVAFHAKPRVAEAAAARIDHNDLTALLFLQGYSEKDFVETA